MPVLDPATMGSTLTIMSSILSIAASVKQLMERERVSANDAVDKYKARASADEILLLDEAKNAEHVKALCSTTMTAALLSQLHREAQACEDRYIANRQKAFDSERDADLISAKNQGERCMCNTLKFMMDHNQGRLPDYDEYQNWFDTYNCIKHI
ncbi:hypothetical protein [Marinobacterium sedimentorum]|uniref:hypothetical protein n=1 Tax=Marinobacterium sedimentorum TaxID=2927804 RepID=UPI0020C73EE2|nr:hypothetical protein [Marinobacterium sedimentorum]MCP8685954.1 hypothetical protein [Marinobacterium sedimentorum]